MLFNSVQYLIFLPIVFLCYWFLLNRNLTVQNLFIVAVSYLFYGLWDWRFLFLIATTSAFSYASGLLIDKYRSYAHLISVTNIVLNLVILCLFKYFNFFAENLSLLFRFFGLEADWVTLDILLPVGISFYTFQALSYTIDVYKKKIEPTHNILSFFAYISFFPQLVAGPIERATNLLPQFQVKRVFNYEKSMSGMTLIIIGLFKKIVVADNCSVIVNRIFESGNYENGALLFIGALFFSFQIYGDFSGYSDIAIGSARLFGFDLKMNFNLPYFSRDIADFWRRWHISLTTWFRDYVYIPLGGSRGTKLQSMRNTFIIFLLSGMWHGANWTFLAWGLFHALLFIPLLLTNRNRKHQEIIAGSRFFPSLKEVCQMGITFLLVTIGWIIFRAESISQAIDYLSTVFSQSLFSNPNIGILNLNYNVMIASISIIILIATDWVQMKKETLNYNRFVQVTFCSIVLFMIIFMREGATSEFIYFQF